MFNQSSDNYDDSAEIQLLLQNMPLDKQSTFCHIADWQEFNGKLISDFGNLETYQREVFKQFSQIDRGSRPSKNSLTSLSWLSTL